MTTLVRGPIKLVTDRPDTVRKINLRAPELRLHGAGIVTDHNDDIPVVDGVVEFEALPGPAVLTLVTAGGAPLRSVDIVVPDEETATLSECLDQTYTYDPPVVGRAQQFAREAGEHADRAEAGADRVGSAEQVGQWVGEAEVLRGDTVQAADRAETQAGVATEQASLARQHREGAEDAETSAHAAAGAAAEATTALIRDEMDGKVAEAGQHAHLAGLSSGAAESKAATAGGHAQAAGQSASAAEQHAETAGGHAQSAGEAQSSVASDRAAISDMISTQIVPIGEQVARDRTAVAGDREATEEARDEAEQHRDEAREAAENAQTGAPPEGWVRADLHADVREDLSRARSALQDVPDATGDARGVIRLSGDLGGTATSPTVPGLADKVDASQVAAPGTAPVDAPGLVPRVSPGGALVVNEAPVGDLDAVSKGHLDERVATRSPVGHRHDVEQIDGLEALVDQRARALRQPGVWFSGDGPPPPADDVGAIPGDFWLDEDSMEAHKYEQEGQ